MLTFFLIIMAVASFSCVGYVWLKIILPGRRYRILHALERPDGWVFAGTVSWLSGVWRADVTLSSLMEEGLIERLTFAETDAVGGSMYRLTLKGAAAVKTARLDQDRVRLPAGSSV